MGRSSVRSPGPKFGIVPASPIVILGAWNAAEAPRQNHRTNSVPVRTATMPDGLLLNLGSKSMFLPRAGCPCGLQRP
jgi:hypothetical protein